MGRVSGGLRGPVSRGRGNPRVGAGQGSQRPESRDGRTIPLNGSNPNWVGKPVWPGSALSELHDLPEAILQCRHLFRCDYAQSTTQAFLCHRSDLVTHRHCRVPITGDRDQDRRAGLRRTRQRHNDHRPSPFIQHPRRNHNAGACLANLRTKRRIQRYPPDITALRDHFHGSAISSPIPSNSLSISATSRS